MSKSLFEIMTFGNWRKHIPKEYEKQKGTKPRWGHTSIGDPNLSGSQRNPVFQ
jgi:hypothetical protein